MTALLLTTACTSSSGSDRTADPPTSSSPDSSSPDSTSPQTVTVDPTPETSQAPTPSTTVKAPAGFRLVWQDEFDNDGPPDPANWNLEHSTFGDGNSELQCYVPQQVTVAEGVLTLTADEIVTTCPNGSTRSYTSGMVTSERLRSLTNGVVEIRARVPRGRGLWPALWMSPEGDVYGRWPNSGEIDLMEIRGNDPSIARVNVHYVDQSGGRAQHPAEVRSQPGRSFADEFHVFGVIWDENRFTWVIDGLVVHEVTNLQSQVGPPPAPFDQPFFLRLNLAVGGTFVGDPDATTPWPATMEIDWVRVFEAT